MLLVAAMVLLAGAALALLLPGNRWRALVAIATQVIATAMVLLRCVPLLVNAGVLQGSMVWSFPIQQIHTVLDPLGAFFLAFSLPMTLLGSIYAVGYLRSQFSGGRNLGVHFALLNLVSLSFIIVYTVENAMIFLLGWEIAAVSAWLLVIFEYKNQKIRFAGFNYLVSTHIGLLLLVAAFLLLYARCGTWDFEGFRQVLHRPGTVRDVTFLLLLASFGLKSAFFPFHTWLPRAHSAAPAHVSALMSGVIHKAGLFALLKFLLMIGKPEEWMGWCLLGFGLLSMFTGVLYTVTQRDLKRLLGYSSTENVGIAAAGFGVGALGLAWGNPTLIALGFTGGLLHILNHAVFKCLLFYGAGAVYRQAHTVDLERLGGLLRVMPVTGILFLTGSLASAALPPLNAFVSEFLLYSALLGSSVPAGVARLAFAAAAMLLAFVGGISALSVVRAFGTAFLGLPRDSAHTVSEDVDGWMKVPMIAHAAGAVLLGVVPILGVLIVGKPALLFGGSAEVPLASAAMLGRVAIGLVATAACLFLLRAALRTRVRRHATWGCGYPSTSPRMQYTASSFSAAFADLFAVLLPQLRRELKPSGPFPATAFVQTHSVDAVEHRMFEVIGNGERSVQALASRMPEETRFGFGLVLAFVIGLVLVLLLSE